MKPRVDSARPPDERSFWWRYQLIRAARGANFWANLDQGTWRVRLELATMDQVFRYVVAIQPMGGRDVGVRAVTVFAEVPQPRDSQAEAGFRALYSRIRLPSATGVTMVGGQSLDRVWPKTVALIERTPAVALDQFGRQLS